MNIGKWCTFDHMTIEAWATQGKTKTKDGILYRKVVFLLIVTDAYTQLASLHLLPNH